MKWFRKTFCSRIEYIQPITLKYWRMNSLLKEISGALYKKVDKKTNEVYELFSLSQHGRVNYSIDAFLKDKKLIEIYE